MLASITDVQDYRQLAQQQLDPALWHYLQEGDVDDNTHTLRDVRLMPRPLQDVRGGHTRLTLLGSEVEHPVLLAPVAYQKLFHADGEAGSALAAVAQGGQCVISSLASQSLEEIVQAASAPQGQGPWFQLYWQGDRDCTLRLLQRAIAAGCSAVVFTVDAPIKRASLQLPPHIQAVNLEPTESPSPDGSMVFDGWMAQAPTWDDVRWLRHQTKLPLMVKGLLHPDDAERALDLGCDALVISNHGGRVLAGTATSLHALMTIKTRLQDRVPLLFDSGIRNGRDVFVALAFGATAVLVGRPYIWGLSAQGAMGVAHVIKLLRDELEMTMALTGCKHLPDIHQACVW